MLAACLAAGCASSGSSRSMTPAEAEKVLVSFRPAKAPAPPRTVEDIALQVSRDNATYYNARNGVKTMVPPQGVSKEALARFYHGRAMTARAAGLLSQWAAESKAAADLVAGSRQEYYHVIELSYAHMVSANPREAITSQQRLIAIAKRFDSPGMLATSHGILALTYAGLGDIREARRMADISRSKYTLARSSDAGAPMWKDAWDADSNLYESVVLAAEGQLQAAEAHARMALAAQLRHRDRMYALMAQRKPLPVPMGWVTNQLMTIRIQLADVLARQ